MNKGLSEFLKQALQPPYVALMTCVLLFLSATAEMARMERQVAPTIAELKGFVPKEYGIVSFKHEYLTDPFGKAIGLSERQLQLCREIASYVPGYESSLGWRNATLLAGGLTLLFLAYKRQGSKLAILITELRRRLNAAALQVILRKLKEFVAERFPGRQQKAAPMKNAMVNNIIPCPSCHQELRVPSGKGRIRVTCSACGHRFETTT